MKTKLFINNKKYKVIIAGITYKINIPQNAN